MESKFINKDKRRYNSMIIQNDYYDAWKISYKYSSILLKRISHEDIYFLCFSIHKTYLNELKHKKINCNQNKNYIQVWNTMINSMKKNYNLSSIRLLQQTSQQKNYNRRYLP